MEDRAKTFRQLLSDFPADKLQEILEEVESIDIDDEYEIDVDSIKDYDERAAVILLQERGYTVLK